MTVVTGAGSLVTSPIEVSGTNCSEFPYAGGVRTRTNRPAHVQKRTAQAFVALLVRQSNSVCANPRRGQSVDYVPAVEVRVIDGDTNGAGVAQC